MRPSRLPDRSITNAIHTAAPPAAPGPSASTLSNACSWRQRHDGRADLPSLTLAPALALGFLIEGPVPGAALSFWRRAVVRRSAVTTDTNVGSARAKQTLLGCDAWDCCPPSSPTFGRSAFAASLSRGTRSGERQERTLAERREADVEPPCPAMPAFDPKPPPVDDRRERGRRRCEWPGRH
ncbi:MAG: hypothetical protein JWQ97_4188 [Phenylobacterium sp.]|nr:hypothetical protein [Phenylobacterium sp.]